MPRSTLLAVGVVAVLAVAAAAWVLPAQAPQEVPRPEVLSDKPVLVVSKHVSAVLEQPRVRAAGGRHFVVGKEAEHSDLTRGGFAGKTLWIPIDDVTQLVELENKVLDGAEDMLTRNGG